MLLALSALPMGAAYAGNVTSPTAVQNVQAEEECKGVVLDATGEPMIGASVVVKGKSGLGTVTDIDGNFTLRIHSFLTYSIYKNKEKVKNISLIFLYYL